MRRLVLAAATLCAVAVAALWSAAARSPAPPPASSLTIAAAPGRAAAVSRELARLGAPVTVRVGSLLQVRAAPGLARAAAPRARRERRRPGRRWRSPTRCISQGARAHRRRRAALARPRRHRHPHRDRRPRLRRQLAHACSARSCRRSRQIDAIQSFDHTSGKPDITGLSNDDQPTGHGANVAQVVWDFAPGRPLHVRQLPHAARALAGRRLARQRARTASRASTSSCTRTRSSTGRSTAPAWRRRPSTARTTRASSGPTRRATTRTATGRASRATPTSDGWADIGPAGRGYLSFPLTAGIGMGATLYWSQCTKGGALVPAASAHFQLDVTDTARRARRSSTPRARATPRCPPARWATRRRRRAPTACASSRARRACSATSRSSAAASSSATRPRWTSSIPTPGDARGSFTVGARDWQGDAAADVLLRRARPRTAGSSPTSSRRPRPPSGPGIAMVGTSASAPHAAGAAALLMQRDRAAGQPSDPDTIAQRADRRARSTSRRPVPTRSPARAASGSTSTRRRGSRRRPPPDSRSATRRASTSTSTTPARSTPRASRSTASRSPRCPGSCTSASTRSALAPGPHTAVFWARDMAGNRSEQAVAFVRDVTPPDVSR